MMKKRIVIAGSCRTPVGKINGSLKSVSAQELLRTCFKGTVERAGIKMIDVDSIVASTCIHSPDAMNVARVALVLAGLPDEDVGAYNKGSYLKDEVLEKSDALTIPGFTSSRNCGSGVQAVISAVQEIIADDSRAVLVGATESMSNSPMILDRGSAGYKMKDALLKDSLVHGLTDSFNGQLMGRLSENTASKWGISREEQDRFAARSHKYAYRAIISQNFESQIVPAKSFYRDILGNINEDVVYEDEGPRENVTPEKLSTVKPYYKKDGTVTAANACTVNDGAASFLVLSLDRARELGIQAEAEIVGYGVAACHPAHMGDGPILAIPKALAKAGLAIDQIDFFEINEAFANVVLATQKHFKIPDEKLNVYGGAIAMGHPVGATGGILTVKAIHILKDFQKDYAMISLCVGGGQGVALAIKRWV